MAACRCAEAALLLLLAGNAAADDRLPTVSIGISTISHIVHVDTLEHEERVGVGPFLVVGWEDPPIDYPAAKGHRLGFSLVPELVGGTLIDDRVAEGMLGAGLRAELRLAQREEGLLRITCRGAVYLAMRGMVIGKTRDPLVEGVFGEYIQTQRGLRFGFELGMVGRSWTQEMDTDRAGFTAQAFLGWGQGGTPLR